MKRRGRIAERTLEEKCTLGISISMPLLLIITR